MADQENNTHDKEMSLWEHLEDLRWTVVRAVIGILVGMILCGIFFIVTVRPSWSVMVIGKADSGEGAAGAPVTSGVPAWE